MHLPAPQRSSSFDKSNAWLLNPVPLLDLTLRWVASWLEQPYQALGNAKSAEFLDTADGRELLASLLAKMQSGAFT